MISPGLKWGHLNSTHTDQEVSVGHHYRRRFHNLSMKLTWLRFSLKYLYANTHTTGSKRGEVEICVQTKTCNCIDFRDVERQLTWLDCCCGWVTVSSGRTEQGRRGIVFYVNRGDRRSTGTFEHKNVLSVSLFLILFLHVSPVKLIS